MAKLSGPQTKALRYLLFVEMYGSMSSQTWHEFDRYSPKSNTLDSLVRLGHITELKTDEFGMVAPGGEHKLTRTAYVSLSTETFGSKEEQEFAYKRLGETGTHVHEAIESLAAHIVSHMTGVPEDEIKRAGADVQIVEVPSIAGTDDGIRSDMASFFRSLFRTEEPAPVELPPLPEPRCGSVLFEEVQCTREPNHESEDHGYSPGYGLEELTWNAAGYSAFWNVDPEFRERTKLDIRTQRNAALLAKEQELQAIANGDTWPKNLTERARKVHKIAQEVCELNGFDPDDVLHAHDGGDHVQICTALPPSKSVERFAIAAGTRVGMELGWSEGVTAAEVAPSTGTVGIVVMEHAHS